MSSSKPDARTISYYTKNHNLSSIVGGGDVVALIKSSGLEDYFSHISTGGGAFLELLGKGDLVGLKNLRYDQ